MTGHPTRIRHAARVVLVSPDDRILLFRCQDPTRENAPVFWITPGGGLEEGESHTDAATRELYEEVGLRPADYRLGPCIWHRQHTFQWLDQRIEQHERFHLARAAHMEVDASGQNQDEIMALTEHRWWSAAEIQASGEDFAPRALGEMLEALLRDGAPAAPQVIGK